MPKNKTKNYPCTICNENCKMSCIECWSCKEWVHYACLDISQENIQEWRNTRLKFFCSKCATTNNNKEVYDFERALSRINSSLSAKCTKSFCKVIANQELLLIETYKAQLLPPFHYSPIDPVMDNTSTMILKSFHPSVLSTHYPINAIGDGNCMYRAAAIALFGTQEFHVQLRLAVVLEVLKYPEFYCTKKSKFILPDVNVVTPYYKDVCFSASRINGYADLIHIYALSAAVRHKFTSYRPTIGPLDRRGIVYTRDIKGRDINSRNKFGGILMWTSTDLHSTKPNIRKFLPNHFCLLRERLKSEHELISAITISDNSTATQEEPIPEFDPEEGIAEFDPELTQKKVSQNLTRKNPTQNLTRKKVSQNLTRKKVSQNLTQKNPTQNLTRKKVSQNLTRKKVSQNLTRKICMTPS
uniref:uncharacterized protein LOC113474952 n=1 Tax=Ciona intestinalis TaxID=7719 RepID=UPI000EF44CE1|nr:uncharacterized protein LOC113474952 [Ciona intestinalis]|eukprot:XP_026693907.1 uncharacterized protein LOC113474952 [Ciona intestinalis]